jgi:hypothetical protein
MVSHSDEVNRFVYVPKDRTNELSSQHSLEMSVKIRYSIHVLEKHSQPRNICGGPQNLGHTESRLNRVGDCRIITDSHMRFG